MLGLGYNEISSIESGDFEGLSNLQGLNFISNEISSIEQGDFTGLENLTWLSLRGNQINSIEQGDFAGLGNLVTLYLDYNWRINSIEQGDFAGLSKLSYLALNANLITSLEETDFSDLSNLSTLYLDDNQIVSIEDNTFAVLGNLHRLFLERNPELRTLNLKGADFLYLNRLSVEDSPIEKVILENALLNQNSFNGIMNSPEGHWYGLAEVSGIKELDLSGVDFSSISEFSEMYAMDDLIKLFLGDATNLAADEVTGFLSQLDSLNYLDVTGLWNEWSLDGMYIDAQNQMLAWDAVEGNILIIPEPATLSLLAIGSLALLRKRKI